MAIFPTLHAKLNVGQAVPRVVWWDVLHGRGTPSLQPILSLFISPASTVPRRYPPLPSPTRVSNSFDCSCTSVPRPPADGEVEDPELEGGREEAPVLLIVRALTFTSGPPAWSKGTPEPE